MKPAVSNEIRRLDLSDSDTIKRILELQTASYSVEAEIIGSDSIPPLHDTTDLLRECGETFYGRYEGGILAGIISFKISGGVLDIHRMAIHPRFFRRGFAGELLAFAEQQADACETAVVCTGKDNVPAIKFYAKHGFVKSRDVDTGTGLWLTELTKRAIHEKNSGKRLRPPRLFKTENGEREFYRAYDRTLTLWKVPFKERDISTRFGATHVIICGNESAPPLVLMHSAQASSTMWFTNVQAFSKHYRLFAVDFPIEAGKSKPSMSIASREEMDNWLLDLFDNLELERAAIVGISRGAWNAVSFAIRHPERMDKLVLLSPAQTFTPITSFSFLWASLRCAFLPSAGAIKKMVNLVIRAPEAVNPIFLDQYRTALRHYNMMNGIGVTPELFTDDELRTVTIPTLLLIGDHDIINSQTSVERANKLLPNVTAAVISDAGHIITIDKPDEVNARILAFLKSETP